MKTLLVALLLTCSGSDTLAGLQHQAEKLCRYHGGLGQWEYFSVSKWRPGPPELHADCLDRKTYWIAVK